MKLLRSLLKLTSEVQKQKDRYYKIKQDPDKQPTYIGYSVRSFIYSALTILSAFTILLLPAATNTSNPLLAFFILIFIVVTAIIAPFLFAVYAFLNSIFQLVLNRKIIGWISLAAAVLTFVPALILILAQLGK